MINLWDGDSNGLHFRCYRAAAVVQLRAAVVRASRKVRERMAVGRAIAYGIRLVGVHHGSCIEVGIRGSFQFQHRGGAHRGHFHTDLNAGRTARSTKCFHLRLRDIFTRTT